jgi:acetyl-CoA acetyltransferase
MGEFSAVRNKTAIVGAGYTPALRHAQTSLAAVAMDAALNAIADAGLERGDIDGYVGTPNGPGGASPYPDGVGQISAPYLAAALGMRDLRFSVDVIGLPSSALEIAIHALCGGLCNYVLMLRAMYNPADAQRTGGPGLRPAGPTQFTLPYGVTGGGPQFAMGVQRYLHDYGAKREELFAVVDAARTHALLNPFAYWHGKPLAEEDYLNARLIYEPLCLLDCDLPVTMAGALIVTTAERARDLQHKPAYISGFAGTAPGRETVFEVSGVDRGDVDVAQIYDGFSPFVWYWLEQLGICETGEAHTWCQNGRIKLGGELPINTAGGNLGEGHFQGFGHLREGAVQIMGRGGDRQVPDAKHCLLGIGQPTSSRSRHAIMLSAADE